ncbi:MAG: DUF4178 domain-containing protein [Silvanigrellales bacterium]|nr:DUF4178 domain-containing protein [Silvanigrellales bacterium]
MIDTAFTREVLGKVALEKDWNPCIALGTDVRLEGRKWRAVGAARRSLADNTYSWEEILLHNPFQGFLWIVFNGGYFYAGKRVNALPEGLAPVLSSPRNPRFEGLSFQYYDDCKAVYDAVRGEFFWQVRTGEPVDMADYVLDGDRSLLLSVEREADEQNCTLLFWIPRAEIAPYLNPQCTLAFPSEASPLKVTSESGGESTVSRGFVVACSVAAAFSILVFRNMTAVVNTMIYCGVLWGVFLFRQENSEATKTQRAKARALFWKMK